SSRIRTRALPGGARVGGKNLAARRSTDQRAEISEASHPRDALGLGPAPVGRCAGETRAAAGSLKSWSHQDRLSFSAVEKTIANTNRGVAETRSEPISKSQADS